VWFGARVICRAGGGEKISLFVVRRLPRISDVKEVIGLSLLPPPAIDCPSCSANMLLDEAERAAKYFVCPGCSAEIDMR
jgi:predicted  nucleic acid-binding Zn ribbon protein